MRIMTSVLAMVFIFTGTVSAQSTAQVQKRVDEMMQTVDYYNLHPDSIRTWQYFMFLDKSERTFDLIEQYLDHTRKILSKAEDYRFNNLSVLMTEQEVDALRYQSILANDIQLLRGQRTVLNMHYEDALAQYPEEMKRLRAQYHDHVRHYSLVLPEKIILSKWMLFPTTALSIGLPIFFHSNKTTLENNPNDPWVLHHAYWGLALWQIGIWQNNWHIDTYKDNVGFRLTSIAAVYVLGDDFYQHLEQRNDGYPEEPHARMYTSPLRDFTYDWWLNIERDIEAWQLTLVEFKLVRKVFRSNDWLSVNFGHYQGPYLGMSYKIADILGLGSLPINAQIVLHGRAIAGWDKGSAHVRKVAFGPTLRADIPFVPFLQMEFGAMRRYYLQDVAQISPLQTEKWMPTFGLVIGSIR